MLMSDRRAENLQAIDWDGRDLLKEISKLRQAIHKTIEENPHLADGNNCTLMHLKRAIDAD